jgi:hypothetical protein
MKLKKSLAAVGTPDFEERLQLELDEHQDLFDLDRWQGSGCVSDVQVDVLDADEDDEPGLVVVSVLVSFEVEVQSSCADISDIDHRAERFVVRIRKSDGEAEVDWDDAWEPNG